MDRHFRWSPRVEEILRRTGASQPEIDEIRHYQAARCNKEPRSPRLTLSVKAQGTLFSWCVPPEGIMEINEYLDRMEEYRLARISGHYKPRSKDAPPTKAAEQKRQYREAHRDEYNAYQRDLMQKKRARERAEKEANRAKTENARLIRWPKLPENEN